MERIVGFLIESLLKLRLKRLKNKRKRLTRKVIKSKHLTFVDFNKQTAGLDIKIRRLEKLL